jgi:hypothetical protein
MAAGDPGSPARYYSSIAVETALSGSIPAQAQGQANTSFIVASVSGFPSNYPYTLIVDPDTSKEEVITVYAGSGTTLSVYRGEDNTQGVAHSAGAVVRHGVSGRDFRESENHIAARGYDIDQTILDAADQTHVHGIATGDGVIVGTDKAQTLNNKTIGSGGLQFEGTTDNGFETTLNVEDPTADRAITFPNTSGTVVILDAVQTLSNKTLGSNLAAGTYKITGLGDPSSAQDATTKNYVDTSMTSQVAQAAASAAAAATSATSASNSATAAATSATSAAASASAASGSASAASTSATAAATSATSAANSATSAATSATNAANSATAAATSATSAAASATASASSASAAATSATSAAASATAAATSATSAAASATAAASSAGTAATSAGQAATSATSAATSATSAAASASAAATSATSASASATAAATSASSASTSASSALTSQTAAATSAASASTSASSALTSATSAATSYDEFDDRYLGAKATPPTVDNDGNALITGALYWNTAVNKMYVWSGTAWGEISSSADIIAYKYTVAGGATSVSGADDNGLTLTYTVGKEQVYINGVLQVRGSDYTATTGSSITGITAMIASDIVTVLAFTAFSVSNTYTQAEADAKFYQTANAFVAGKNKIINGDFAINQRGFTSVTASSTYTFDRWLTILTGGTVTYTPQTFSPGTAPVAGYEGTNFIQIATSGQTTQSQYTGYIQRIEDVRTLANQTITVSFWAKATSGTPYLWLEYFQNFGSGGSSAVNGQIGSTITLSTSWTRYSVSVAIPSISGKTIGTSSFLETIFWTSLGSSIRGFGNATFQNSTIQIWGVQAEAGSIATPFQTATGTIAGELAACQRYYWRNTAFQSSAGVQSAYDNNVWFSLQNFNPVPMRTTPTAAIEGTPYIADFQANLRDITSVNCNSKYVVGFTYSSTKLTSNLAFGLNFSDAGRALSFSSEL